MVFCKLYTSALQGRAAGWCYGSKLKFGTCHAWLSCSSTWAQLVEAAVYDAAMLQGQARFGSSAASVAAVQALVQLGAV